MTSLLDELAGYYKSPAVIGRIFALEGDAYASQGDYQAAAEAYLQALEVFPAVQQVNLELCRVYGLMEQAEQALPYCDKAARANPSFWTYLHRGKVYAQLGRLDEARADFEKVAAQLKSITGPNEKMLYQELVGWIETLQTGKNPITPELIRGERQLETVSALPTQTIEEKAPPSAKSFQEAAATYGFGPFEEVKVKDPFQDIALPFIGSSMKLGSCLVDLALQADEKMIYKVMMTMKGCSDLEEYFMGLRLVDEFFPDKTEKARAVVWMFKEANLVIEAQKREAKSIHIRKCNLYSSYQRADQSTQWFFSCH